MKLVFLVNYDLPALLALNRILPACDRTQHSNFLYPKTDLGFVPGA